jgi:hypothetical protein
LASLFAVQTATAAEINTHFADYFPSMVFIQFFDCNLEEPATAVYDQLDGVARIPSHATQSQHFHFEGVEHNKIVLFDGKV